MVFQGHEPSSLLIPGVNGGDLSTISTCKYMSTTASFPRKAEGKKEEADRCLSKETPRTVFWPTTGFDNPAFSLELRSAPTAILKVQPPICLDYRARNRPQLIGTIILKAIKYKSKNGEFEMNLKHGQGIINIEN